MQWKFCAVLLSMEKFCNNSDVNSGIAKGGPGRAHAFNSKWNTESRPIYVL